MAWSPILSISNEFDLVKKLYPLFSNILLTSGHCNGLNVPYQVKHYYGFYVPPDQRTSKQYRGSAGPGSVWPQKPNNNVSKCHPPTLQRIHKVLLAQSHARTRWSGNPSSHHQASLSLQHPSRERNYQCPQGALIISLPHVFPPHICGFW